jgi:hypothetical protein
MHNAVPLSLSLVCSSAKSRSFVDLYLLCIYVRVLTAEFKVTLGHVRTRSHFSCRREAIESRTPKAGGEFHP